LTYTGNVSKTFWKFLVGPGSMTVTLKSIAKRVGKSVTTVSRALAGYEDVSEATREQVRQVALELGYEPNII
jgi:cyanate lyase